MSLFKRFLVALCILGCSRLSADETLDKYQAAYNAMVTMFDRVQLDVHSRWNPDFENLSGANEFIADVLKRFRENPGDQDLFRNEMAENGVVIGPGIEGIEAYFHQRLEDENRHKTNLSKYDTYHTIAISEIPQVRLHLNQMQLEQATSNRVHRLLQFGLQHLELPAKRKRWTCLDEKLMGGLKFVWCKDRITIDAVSPPGIRLPNAHFQYPTGLDSFWTAPRDTMSVFVRPDGILVLQVNGDNPPLLAKFPPGQIVSVPNWLCSCAKQANETKPDAQGLTLEASAIEAERCVQEFVERGAFGYRPAKGELLPDAITRFEQRESLDRGLQYPLTTSLFHFVGTSANADQALESLEYKPDGAFQCLVSDVSFEVQAPDPISIESGTSYLDLDTNESFVIGRKRDDSSRNLSGSQGYFSLLCVAILIAIAMGLIVNRVSNRRPESH